MTSKENRQTHSISIAVLLITVMVSLMLTGCSQDSVSSKHVEYLTSWGSKGSADGQFLYIEDFAFDMDGNLLVSDALRADVQILDHKTGNFIARIGGKRTGPEYFEKPKGVGVDDNGNIYIGDYLAGDIKKFGASYKHLKTFSSLGS